MKEKRLLELKVYLTCDDRGLNTDNAIAGYAKNIAKMHERDYISVDKSGRTTERIKLQSIITRNNEKTVKYVNETT